MNKLEMYFLDVCLIFLGLFIALKISIPVVSFLLGLLVHYGMKIIHQTK